MKKLWWEVWPDPGLVEKSLEAKMNKQLHLHEEKEWEVKSIPMTKNSIKAVTSAY